MTRLPNRLQPAWPLVKRLHRLASRVSGYIGRATGWLSGARAVPRRATTTVDETVARELQSSRLHRVGDPARIDRPLAVGSPAAHWVFEDARTASVAAPYVLSLDHGIAVGDNAVVTSDGTLDYETSEYFGVTDWREHPLYLRRRLPKIENLDGDVVVLACRGGSINYYHFLLDVLPRFGIAEQVLPDLKPDALYVPAEAAWQKGLLELTGLDAFPIVAASADRAIRADRLLVPGFSNRLEVAPQQTVDWLRERLPAKDTTDKPKLLYVTRGNTPNTRRIVQEDKLWPLLEDRGFFRLEPGGRSIQEQIDYFAAADVIVAPHGAALTNLVFAKPGVRVLEMFTASYVNPCFWAISQGVPGAIYRYLITGDTTRYARGRVMNSIQADIDVNPQQVLAAIDDLMEA